MENNKPIRKQRVKLVETTLWKNKVQKEGDEYEIMTLGLSKSYNKDGEWNKNTVNFNIKEIPELITMLNDLYSWYLLKYKESEQRGED